jgi:chorismate mutase/GNAT superfamily N-acetyltransferase
MERKMKKAENCNSIYEIRECIDSIDNDIIDAIVLRSTFVHHAVKFKSNLNEVKADDRVKSMLADRKERAKEKGLAPEFIQDVFEVIVRHFISSEKKIFKKTASDEFIVKQATLEDARTILGVQKRAFIQEAEKYGNNYNIAPIIESLEEMQEDFKKHIFVKAIKDDLLIGSARARMDGSICYIGRVVVEPIYQRRGYGKLLMTAIEELFSTANEYELFTGAESIENVGFYEKLGYSKEDVFAGSDKIKLVRMRKVTIK